MKRNPTLTCVLAAGLLLPLLAGCASVSSVPRPRDHGPQGPQEAPSSLFPGDAVILDDARIADILAARLQLPTPLRVALLHFGHRSAERSSFLFQRTGGPQSQLGQEFVRTLRASPHVFDASYLPSFLVPERPGVPQLREAAARYQADLLLVYRTDVQLYEKHSFWTGKGKEVRAACVAECAILDVRTGIVPFTSRAVHEFTTERQEDDLEFAETLRRAEAAAADAAMAINAANLVEFLDRELAAGR